MKKGFTLIELLAVIVILAIIALISTPMILGIIEKAKKGGAESSALGYIDAVEKTVATNMLDTNKTNIEDGVYEVSKLKSTKYDVKVKGEQPTEDSWVKIEKGQVTACSLKIGEYVVNCNGETIKNGEIVEKPSDDTKPVSILCKKATTLHREKCQQSDSNYTCLADGYTVNSTITYGKVPGDTLTTGDAYTCDVNGDGTFDETTERFYYLTDMDSKTAVFVYYNNVSNGTPNSTALSAYDNSGKSNYGPVIAKKQLPTSAQWSNTSLTKTSRQILNEKGETSVADGNLPIFSYEGYSARLLTYQEVTSACLTGSNPITYVGSLSTKCQFLMENTTYSSSSNPVTAYWLETPDTRYGSSSWLIFALNRNLNSGPVKFNSSYAVRPAIEVLKTRIAS